MEAGSQFTEFLPARKHEYYSELCALAASGSLNGREWAELASHVEVCETCRQELRHYRAVAKLAMPIVASQEDNTTPVNHPSWSLDAAKKELFARIASGNARGTVRAPEHEPRKSERPFFFAPPLPSWFRVAAAILIATALSLFGFYLGRSRGEAVGREQAASHKAGAESLRSQLENLQQDRQALDQRLKASSSEIETLRAELQQQNAEVSKWQLQQQQAQRDLQQKDAAVHELASAKTSLAAERDVIRRQLQETESSLTQIQNRLDTLQQDRTRDLLRTASLDEKINQLSLQLKESNDTIQRQQQFLVADRDVRELMGARDLYIADVFDIDHQGKTQKVFGRVFYTSGKSLIFYAFDLERQPGIRDAAAFQAWGRRGPGDKRPLNMGIFYLDNEANKRWVLRFDDAKLLAQIDAVFVTVEPRGGRQKPSGKQLLFASLRTPPNHP